MVTKMGTARKILWHDGFATPVKTVMKDAEFETYANSIIDYAKNNDYDTVSLTALGSQIVPKTNHPSDQRKGFLPSNKTAYKYLNQFIAKAEGRGLSVGLNVYQKNNKTDSVSQLVEDISDNITHSRPLTIGIDSETNNLTKAQYDSVTGIWEDALKANDVNYDDFIILGGASQEPAWTQSSNFKNGYEYYSWDTPNWRKESSAFNDKISGDLKNDPKGALAYIQQNITAGNIDGPITKNTYNGQVPIFSIGTGNGTNTLGRHLNNKAIGPAVFGTWEPAQFNTFLNLWNNAYPDTTDIIVYHGDQLPNDWLNNL